ncbi:MAG: protein kinase [Polyangiaceae bacterium]|nr:protein kinase [Polyangiaceae bacterium]
MVSDPLVGALLGRTYRVLRLLGRGAMGAVYEARHEALNRIVALKVLAPEISAQPQAVARLEREAQAAAQLGHPNIVPVTDFRALPGEPAFLVMEYLQGKSLEQVMQESGKLLPSRAASMGIQVLDALAVAHRAGIVHRDIKPANLMVTAIPGAGEVVKILDFGVAKVTESHGLTRDGVLIGSPLFMAPEQAFHDTIDGRADLYALGATLYYAISGVPPLEADSLPRMLSKLKDEAPMPLAQRCPQVDPALGAALDRALLKHPDTRYANADEMRTALQRFALALSPSFSNPQVVVSGAPVGPSGPPPGLPAPSGPSPYGPPPQLAANFVSGTDSYGNGATGYGPPPGLSQSPSGYGPAPGYGPPAQTGLPVPQNSHPGAPAVTAPPGVLMGGPPPVGASIGAVQVAPRSSSPGAGIFIAVAAGILLLGGVALGTFFYLRQEDTLAAVPRPSASSAPISGPLAVTTSVGPSTTLGPSPTPGVVPPLPSGSRSGTAPVPSPTTPRPSPTASASVQPAPSGSTVAVAKPWAKECNVNQYPTYADADAIRPFLSGKASSLTQCAALACFRHDKSRDVGYDFESFGANLDLKGNVVGVQNRSSGCAALYACVLPIMRTWKFPAPQKTGEVVYMCGFREAPTND